MGFEVVVELAKRGARLLLLCANMLDVKNRTFVTAMRNSFNNKQIYAIPCDLRSKHSVDAFIWNWSQTNNPRRLDGIICCATGTIKRRKSLDGVVQDEILAVNYVLQRYLVNGLRSALLSQPSHRDVRIVITTSSLCEEWPELANDFFFTLSKYLPKALKSSIRKYSQLHVSKFFFQSQLIFGLYGRLLQSKLNKEKRSDGSPSNVIVSIVDPGLIRNKALMQHCFEENEIPSKGKKLRFRLMTQSCYVGAQSILYALFSLELKASNGGSYVRNCRIVKELPSQYSNEETKFLYELNGDYHVACIPKDGRPFELFHIPNFEH